MHVVYANLRAGCEFGVTVTCAFSFGINMNRKDAKVAKGVLNKRKQLCVLVPRKNEVNSWRNKDTTHFPTNRYDQPLLNTIRPSLAFFSMDYQR